MNPVIRKSVRVLLLNPEDKLLLMCIEGFDIATSDGKRNDRFWCTIGGGIETTETLKDAALREIYEETGISAQEVALGPIVWYGEVDLMLKGELTRLHETFIVAKTKKDNVQLHQPTNDEKAVVKKLAWFSLEDIKSCEDVIFPVLLLQYLPDIILNNYPEQPIEIDLKVEPK